MKAGFIKLLVKMVTLLKCLQRGGQDSERHKLHEKIKVGGG